jgi:hypothetical protein
MHEWHKHCRNCSLPVEEGWEYSAGPEDGKDGWLPDAPEKDSNMSEEQKKGVCYATHDDPHKMPSRQYRPKRGY